MRLEIKCSPEYAAPLNRKPTELRKGEFPPPGALWDELPSYRKTVKVRWSVCSGGSSQRVRAGESTRKKQSDFFKVSLRTPAHTNTACHLREIALV